MIHLRVKRTPRSGKIQKTSPMFSLWGLIRHRKISCFDFQEILVKEGYTKNSIIFDIETVTVWITLRVTVTVRSKLDIFLSKFWA